MIIYIHYSLVTWEHQDSNLEPPGFQPSALPIELWTHMGTRQSHARGLGCLSPPGQRDSNPQPPALETGALPIELYPNGTAVTHTAPVYRGFVDAPRFRPPGGIRTPDPRLRKPMLYPLSYKQFSFYPCSGLLNNPFF